MTQAAVIMMSLSLFVIVTLFLFCIGRVLTAPAPVEYDDE